MTSEPDEPHQLVRRHHDDPNQTNRILHMMSSPANQHGMDRATTDQTVTDRTMTDSNSADPSITSTQTKSRAADPASRLLDVSALLAFVQATLPTDPIVVSGTLVGVRRSRSGWVSGELCDYEGPGVLRARVPIVTRSEVASAGAVRLADGVRVSVTGSLEVSPVFAPLRLVVHRVVADGLDPFGVGARAVEVERLRSAGCFDQNKTQLFPATLRRIGLVAPASGGAGRSDFLERMYADNAITAGSIRIVERPVPMSGLDAAFGVASAIRELGASSDVVVVVRGGGPASELTVFDHPAVADAIVNSQCPVVLAVGHSTDSTLADLVAAMSVSTPTAAAVWLLDHNQATATATRERRQRDAERLAQCQLEAAAQQSAHAQHALQEATQLAARTRKTIRFTFAAAFAISLVAVVVLLLLR